MRHGRKSRSKRFDGYKEHIARDQTSGNRRMRRDARANRPPEELGAVPIAAMDFKGQRLRLVEPHIDRALRSTAWSSMMSSPRAEPCSPNRGPGARTVPACSPRADFKIDPRAKTITRPAGEVESFEPGDTVDLDP